MGKGITYDTGGADIKAGGVMAGGLNLFLLVFTVVPLVRFHNVLVSHRSVKSGMSRDKCGAAAVAGLMASIAAQQPQGVKVGEHEH